MKSKQRLRYITLFLVSVIAIIIMGGCCLGNFQCEPFESLNVGEKTNVGGTVSTAGLSFIVEQFQWGNGVWTSSGHAEVYSRNYTNGSGLCINSNNVNLNFQHDFPVTEIKLEIADLGGNTNITVNGEFRNMKNIVDLNGATIGGVQLTINASQSGNNWIGDMMIRGDINSFSIGGQELWIDDYCYNSN